MKISKLGEPTKKVPWFKGRVLILAGLAIMFLPFVVVGVCKAYDDMVLKSLEQSLASNVVAITANKKACDASYEALKGYKTEAKIALLGTGNPCF